MAKMKKGFYFLNKSVYYGEYPAEQTSGWVAISALMPQLIKTEVPFSDDDKAVRLFENHAFTEREFLDFERGLEIIFKCAGITEFKEIDFTAAEKRLGISLPREIKILYRFLGAAGGLTEGTERFLSLDELCTDGGYIVFYRIKRTLVGLSVDNGTVGICHKGVWEYSKGDENFFYAVNRIVVKTICSMPFVKEGKITGALRAELSPQYMLREIFTGRLDILEEYYQYGNIVLYSEDGALGWFRSNGFSADIMIGSRDEALFEKILSAKLEVKWSGAPPKKI